MTNLIKAVLAVMGEVKNIDKNLNVGTGASSYKGVADKDVKQIVGEAMQKHGLVILPQSIDPKTTVSEWDAEEVWSGKTQVKHKTQILTEVLTTYTLYHVSGESVVLTGYGHGVDSQDKSAGKATTYALKNTLLYTFLVPTGSIDDTDTQHSNEMESRPRTASVRPPTASKSADKPICQYHKVAMFKTPNMKDYAHRDEVRGWCNGKGYKDELDAWREQNKEPAKEKLNSNLAQEVAGDVPF